MNRIAVLDANAYIDLEGPLEPDSCLAELSSLAFQGKISLYLTPELRQELRRNGDPARRKRQIAHTTKFPRVPTGHEGTVRTVATELEQIIFSEASSSKKRPQRSSDCLQLAYAVEFQAGCFVTRDRGLLRHKKVIEDLFGLCIITPEELLEEIKRPKPDREPIPLATPSLLITQATQDHIAEVSELLKGLEEDYPGFLSDWLPKQFEDPSFLKKVEILNNQVASVSITKDKGGGVVKLSTFFIDPRFRELGLGQHLLHHELVNWAHRGIRKVIVTIPSRNQEMFRFFRKYGFFVEGLSPLRYGSRAEVIMGRYLLHEVIKPEGWKNFVERFLSDILLHERQSSDLEEVWLPKIAGEDMAFPFVNRPVMVEDEFGSGGTLLKIKDSLSNEPIREWDTYKLETEFYPLLLDYPDRSAAILPIEPGWAELLFEFERQQHTLFESQERVRLRSDNVYYRRGTNHGRIRRGTPLVFYISGEEGKVAAVAKTHTAEIGAPQAMHAKYGPLGVLNREEVEAAAGELGRVQAIRFDYLEPLLRPIRLPQLRKIAPNINLQTTSAVPFETYLRIRCEGGLPNAGAMRSDVHQTPVR
jgi:predicted nucleic acid-binding protein/ribosomal protein S18 acetylase RimI-like enzyme